MKTIPVPADSKIMKQLLHEASLEEIILEASDGQRFVLAPLGDWEGFELGVDDDITNNSSLLGHLRERRTSQDRIPLEEVKRRIEASD